MVYPDGSMNVDSSVGTDIYSVFAEASDSRKLAVKKKSGGWV